MLRNMEDLNKRIETEGPEHLRLDSNRRREGQKTKGKSTWRSPIHGLRSGMVNASIEQKLAATLVVLFFGT